MGNQKIDKLEKLYKSKLFVGGNDWIDELCTESSRCCSSCPNSKSCLDNFTQFRDKVRILLKSYLQLDNVSFLFGTGSSLHLGARSIRNIPKEIEDAIQLDTDLYDLFNFLVKQYQGGFVKRNDNGEIKLPLENFLNYLLALEFSNNNSKDSIFKSTDEKAPSMVLLPNLITTIKQTLFNLCDLDSHEATVMSDSLSPVNKDEEIESKTLPDEEAPPTQTDNPIAEMSNKNTTDDSRYYYHKHFLKSLLQRPLNLKRANIFTINYDLAFERSFDELGIHYIDGFVGFHNRVFRPEVYEYDLYYPGSTTEGKVRRIERVVRYFKLHGSISWVGEKSSASNIYGLVEKPLELIRQDETLQGNIMIYPSSMKKRYTLDFPYSELFRHFAAAITHPQSVLFCVGYSFSDEHINDIIYQALAIPSFTLIIVDYKGISNPVIRRLRELSDPRIIILQGEYLGDFKIFSTKLMPNFHEMDIQEKVAITLAKLHPQNSPKGEKSEC